MSMKHLRALTTGAAIAVLCALSGGTAATAAVISPAATKSSPVRVAVVLPLTVPNDSGAFISAEALERYTAPDGFLSSRLDEAAGSAVTLAIDPMIIASIRVLGTSAPESATGWLTRLSLLTNDSFALAWADSDLTAPLQAGEATVLEPTSLDYAIDPDLFAAAPDEAPTPAPTGEPEVGDVPALPTTESLLAWDYTMADVAWPVAGTVAADDVAAIAESGFTTTILESTNVTRSSASNAVATVARTKTVVVDTTLSSGLRDAADATTPEGWVDAISALEDGLESVPTASGGSVVLSFDRETAAANARIGETVVTLENNTSIEVVPLSTIADDSAGRGKLIDSPQSAGRIRNTRSLLAAEQRDDRFATVAETPGLITGERRLDLLTTLAPAPNRHPGGFGASVADYVADSRTLEQSVRLVKSSEILLLADRSSIYVSVANDLDQPVTVYVSVRALSPLLRVEDSRVEITIEPDSQKKAQVPVQSVSNGRVSLEVGLTSVTNDDIGTPTLVRINVQAGWEGPVTWVLGAFVVIIFAAGIYRNLIVRRRPVQPSPELPRSE